MKLSKATLTFVKYLFWTAMAAGIAALSGNLDHLSIPTMLIPIAAAFLKSIATYVETEIEDVKPDKE